MKLCKHIRLCAQHGPESNTLRSCAISLSIGRSHNGPRHVETGLAPVSFFCLPQASFRKQASASKLPQASFRKQAGMQQDAHGMPLALLCLSSSYSLLSYARLSSSTLFIGAASYDAFAE